MRILQVGKFYYPAHGGIETLLRNLAEGLRRAGDEVTVLCSAAQAYPATETINGVRVRRAAYFGTLLSQPLSPTLPLELLKLARSFDLVHVHTPNPLAESASLLLPGHVPLIVSHHSDIVRQKLVLPVYSPLLRRFLKRADRVVVATRNHVTSSPFLRAIEAKCAIIPYGIDPAPFAENAVSDEEIAELRTRYGRFVLFVGRLVGYKGVSVLIEAMRQVPVGASLVIVGGGPLQQSLTEQAAEAGLAARVHFTGNLPADRKLAAFYRAAELLILPSITKAEAFGLVQVEAMACARPSIVTRLDSGVPLVTEDGVTGLHVTPGDSADLARAINRLLADDGLRARMGAAARVRFEERYTRERMVEIYRELYSSSIRS